MYFVKLFLHKLRKNKVKSIFLTLALGMSSYGINAYFFALPPPEPERKIVETKTISPQLFEYSVKLLGTVHPKHATILFAKTTGMLDILIPSGKSIKKGTLIAKIVDPNQEDTVVLTQNSETLLKSQLKRLAPLHKKGFISANDLEERKQAWLSAKKELSRTKIELDNFRFYAPFDAKIGIYKKREGTQINSGEPLVTLYDPQNLVVDFHIPCTNLPKIQTGQQVRVLNKIYSLTNFQAMLDEETHMCPAEVEIECQDCLIGDTIPLELVITSKPNSIVIPFEAVFYKNSTPYVYTVENQKVILTSIKIGIQNKNQVEILEGLAPGQQIVIRGHERLFPEMIVSTIPIGESNNLG
ncbi:efflux protein (plasmid) [Legionella adelaidensis]|uniref:Efflux protein n=1 Tax=Legionella adelaidensis TaxID=45056 RepID=A0A0W0R1G4_9GAMM|nr:efflux RND transporter periplasmic adaptor subunit [Legionella adelaidensis]KTC64927.1 efflux protein [Legionella adelaidensis]VEH85610.1 efflux protein [Legionella adelaidensis]